MTPMQRIAYYKGKITRANKRLTELNASLNILQTGWIENIREQQHLEANIYQWRGIISNIRNKQPSHGHSLYTHTVHKQRINA